MRKPADTIVDDAILPRGWMSRERGIRRKMTFEQFERNIPFRPGWKREYFGGKAYVRPSWSCVHFHCDLSPVPIPLVQGFRTPTRADAEKLALCFFDSFRFSPQYAGYPMAAYRKATMEYISNFYGEKRGVIHPASTVVVSRHRIVSAFLIKIETGKLPLVDCVFTRPSHLRKGLARNAARRAFAILAKDGFRKVRSSAMLANESSIHWHLSVGFQELPNAMLDELRARFGLYEADRLKDLGQISEVEFSKRKREAIEKMQEAETRKDKWYKGAFLDERFYYEYGFWPKPGQNGDL